MSKRARPRLHGLITAIPRGMLWLADPRQVHQRARTESMQGAHGKMKVCLFGQHKWGVWEYATDGDCRQVRVCTRPECGARGEQVKHEWDAWTYRRGEGANDCVQERICTRCASVEARTEHEWAALYVAEDSCWKTLKCRRCGQPCEDLLFKARNLPQTLRPIHLWSVWEAVPDACQDARTCDRCGERQTREVAHTWSAWDYTTAGRCEQARRCIRCQVEERRITHDWNDWVYRSARGCDMTRTCVRCGEVEASADVGHEWSVWQYYDRRTASVKAYCCRCRQAVPRPGMTGQADVPETARQGLRRAADQYFSEENLKTLCYDLGVDYDNLPGEGKANRFRELIADFERREELPRLVEWCFRERPTARA